MLTQYPADAEDAKDATKVTFTAKGEARSTPPTHQVDWQQEMRPMVVSLPLY